MRLANLIIVNVLAILNLPQGPSSYPCGHGTVFSLQATHFRPTNFHPRPGTHDRTVRSPAESPLRRPSTRALCLVMKKNQRVIGQLEATMAKYNTLNRIQASDEQEVNEWDTFLDRLVNVTRGQSPISQMYSFTSAINQSLALILSAENLEYSTHFNPQQTALREIERTRAKLQQLQCGLYLVLKKGGTKFITSSHTRIPNEDVVFYQSNPDRARRFKKDFQIFGSALRLLEMAGRKVGAKIVGPCP